MAICRLSVCVFVFLSVSLCAHLSACNLSFLLSVTAFVSVTVLFFLLPLVYLILLWLYDLCCDTLNKSFSFSLYNYFYFQAIPAFDMEDFLDSVQQKRVSLGNEYFFPFSFPCASLNPNHTGGRGASLAMRCKILWKVSLCLCPDK